MKPHLPSSNRAAGLGAALVLAGLVSGCGTVSDSIVSPPTLAPPTARPINIERLNNGAIFQVGMQSSPFSVRRKPRNIGDTLKVDISESLSASNKVTTDTSRENAVATKGPGTSSTSGGLINKILNLNDSASGSDSFKGSGSTENTSSFTGMLAASVINVLSNGNLVIAGERSVALNGGVSTLRFSGIVDPKDLSESNLVASSDVVNAKLEVLGRGDVSEAGRRSWLQRILTNSLSIW
ncbi:flagellar biosynthesis protein FlgH [Rhodoferax koreense]|uniref:Flagellar L-ring protein n=1 Tax=Rhodoferax koreensis TaxID=1842727 RepID=A0A1P8JXX4_9BURK|nr:flagellar basal body L-ring protein FlgH [Rhodoferax koreense]APW38609.1 flagellar biosynthesis protein FlgH [Rhodoferax koreense]